jgi:membrane fusion protein
MSSNAADTTEAGRRDAPGSVVVAHFATLAPRNDASLQLFRPEVLVERQAQWAGTVVLAPRTSHRLFTLAALVACAGVFALLFFAHYTRTARINGLLVPQEGVARVFAPRPGVVTNLFVAEGAQVHRGDRLLSLSDEVQSTNLGATQSQIARWLTQRRESLVEEQTQSRRLLTQQQAALTDRIGALDSEHAQMENEIRLLQARAAIAERSEALHRQQFELGFISEMRLQAVEAEKLEQRARLAALERSRLSNRRERIALQGELKDLPLRYQGQAAGVERSMAQLEQERAEAEARREFVVPAPQDGTVTAIQAVRGASADGSVPLMSIVPADVNLEAHLYSPSRAVGFISPGQRVLLRHQAFPYQKFGHQEGVVVSVSRSAVSPAELPKQLAGLAALMTGGAAPEPIYRITVSLADQSIRAEGKQMALQPGMLLEADVALEQRRLFEWVLDPLYSVTRRWRD